jgi:hypothetical protein
MPKWAKLMIAILLLPVCLGAVKALLRILPATGSRDTIWVALLAGALCWIVIFLMLPKPMWIYVFGHELTHALWTWAFGGRVKKFKATANGGHVVITRTNFVIVLAPYFFPLYVALVVAVFLLGHLFWNWSRYYAVFHLLVGAAYAFHVTLTWNALQTRQSDITSQGYLFSAVIIFLGNISALLLGIPLLTGTYSILQSFGVWAQCTGDVLKWLARVF